MSKTSRGFIWSFFERFSVQGISFLLSILLARLIAPESYGLLVMVQVFTSISEVFVDSGFGQALIQKKDRTNLDYNTVFIFNIVVAFFLYVALFLLAPIISNFYEEPKLTLITRVVGLNLIFSSFAIVQRTRLMVLLDFKTISKASLVSVILGGCVGVYCAFNGYEVWALVYQGLVSSFTSAIILMFVSRWKPNLEFSWTSFKKLFGFGSKLMLNSLITKLYLDLYNLIIGKVYSSAQLAYYNRSFKLSQFPSVNINDVMNRVIYPVECEAQNDEKQLKLLYFKYLHLTNYITMPLLSLMAVLSKPLIIVVLTEKWIGASPYLTIFCINFILYSWLNQATNVISAKGRSDYLLKAMVIRRIISFIILGITVFINVYAVCIGISVCTAIELAILLFFQKKATGYSIKEQIHGLLSLILSNIIIVCVAILIVYMFNTPIIQLVVCSVICSVLYLLLTFLFQMPEKKIFIGFFSTFNKWKKY